MLGQGKKEEFVEESAEKVIDKTLYQSMQLQQAEAKEVLTSLSRKQQEFQANYGYYTPNLSTIKEAIPLESKYEYRIQFADANAFAIMAIGNIDNDQAKDVWLIDASGQLQHIVDDIVE